MLTFILPSNLHWREPKETHNIFHLISLKGQTIILSCAPEPAASHDFYQNKLSFCTLADITIFHPPS